MSVEVIARGWSRDWLDIPFSMQVPEHRKGELRESWKRLKYVYLSALRPLSMVRPRDLGAEPDNEVRFFDVAGTKTLVFAERPLPVDPVDAYELTPYTVLSMGRYILDVAAGLGQPVELKRQHDPKWPDAHEKAVALFRNPRGVWQLSYFEEGVGPTGHEEAKDDPATMVGEAWLTGYRILERGIADRLMGTVA